VDSSTVPAIGSELAGLGSQPIGSQPGAAPDASDEERGAAIESLLRYLDELEMFTLSTIDRNGWPMTHCMHFSTLRGPGSRPVFYMFTHDKTRKLLNINADPRVAVSCIDQFGGVPPKLHAPVARMQGLARLITDTHEIDLALRSYHVKKGYDFLQFVSVEGEPLIRIDVVNAEWDAAGAGDAVLIDFAASFAPAAPNAP
jgi:hypothetical protein